MNISVYCAHVGAQGGHGGGEHHTFAFLNILSSFYNVRALVNEWEFPAFDRALADYGLPLDIPWEPLHDLSRQVRSADVFISIAHSSLPAPLARRNILVTFFPQHPGWDVSGYDTVIANSQFTAKWIKTYWGVDAAVVYPPVNVSQFRSLAKSNSIVSIGRFFDVPGGNNKNHILLVNQFKRFADSRPEPWELHLIGQVQHEEYFRRVLQSIAGDDRIVLHHDVPRASVLDLLARARFLWSATGWNTTAPSAMEHLGMSAIEAMASGCIPVVHNSGGMPETGAVTWDEPDDLLRITSDLASDPARSGSLASSLREQSEKFSLEVQAEGLVEVIECLLLLPPRAGQTKIFLPEKKPSDIKVGVWSDSPALTSGFGIVTRMVVEGLLAHNFQVACLGMYDTYRGPETGRDDPCRIWRVDPGDFSGVGRLDLFLRQERPDVLYMNYDPGNLYSMMHSLEKRRCRVPPICYIPIEGEPLLDEYIVLVRAVFQRGGIPLVYTKWGADVIRRAGGPVVDWIHHGLNHATWGVMPPDRKERYRFSVGWNDRHLVTFHGRNKSSKGMSRLIAALAWLKDNNVGDVIAYLHTNPEEVNPSLHATPLRQLASSLGLSGSVFFPPDLKNQFHGVSFNDPPRLTVEDTDDIGLLRRYNLAAMTLVERFQIADVFVDCSYREGFGLPAAQALACGVPVIAPDDDSVRREVLGDAAFYVKPHDVEFSHLNARMYRLHPADIGRAILMLRRDDDLRNELIERGLGRAAELTWGPLQDRIAQEAVRLANR